MSGLKIFMRFYEIAREISGGLREFFLLDFLIRLKGFGQKKLEIILNIEKNYQNNFLRKFYPGINFLRGNFVFEKIPQGKFYT